MDFTSYFEYNTSSPSCLTWAFGAASEGKGSAERKPNTTAGSLAKGFWNIQVIEGEVRYRTNAHRVVWEIHNGFIPDGMVVLHREGRSNNIENLMCVTRTQHNLIKAWKSGKANVRPTGSGRFFATIRGHKSLGTYDTYAEAEQVYRIELRKLVEGML